MQHNHYTTVQNRTTVKRKYYLNKVDPDDIRKCRIDLESVQGIRFVEYQADQNYFEIHFDARLTSSQMVTTILQENHLHLRSGFVNRSRLSWYRFTEQNIKDNEKASKWKCH